jgi:isopenicillin-N epimerase
MRARFTLDPEITFLNHGSFGACPREVQETQRALRDRMERQPVQLFMRDLEGMLDDSRARLADFLGARPGDLVFTRNATYAVNAVLRSLELAPGDELLTTDQGYGACLNALEFVAARSGARVVTAATPFPVDDPADLIDPILDAVTPRTRLAVLDHIASPTGVVFPLERIVPELEARGVRVLVDGAHAPGHVYVDLDTLGASFATGNCHKWLFAPKGAAYLHVREDRHGEVRPLAISHGATNPRDDRPRLHLEFDWTGTDDPTSWLSVPAGIDFGASLFPGGWSELRERNRALVLEARALLAGALDIELPCPDELVGCLASLPLPDAVAPPWFPDPLQTTLLEEHGVEVPIIPWPSPPRRLLRISAQVYNELDDYRRLAEALKATL